MPDTLFAPEFWVAVLQIIMIDVVLSGDNAVVIALACRNLPPEQRRKGIVWGVAGAIGLRVVLTAIAAVVMNLPWLKLLGGLLLFWISVKLMVPDEDEDCDIEPARHLWGAIRTIVVADFVMSLDNVIGVAGASQGNLFLLLFGLVVSIPLIVWSSQIILHFLERWPVIVTLGAALLGWIAAGMVWSDAVLAGARDGLPAWIAYPVSAAGAIAVVAIGKAISRRRARKSDLTIE